MRWTSLIKEEFKFTHEQKINLSSILINLVWLKEEAKNTRRTQKQLATNCKENNILQFMRVSATIIFLLSFSTPYNPSRVLLCGCQIAAAQHRPFFFFFLADQHRSFFFFLRPVSIFFLFFYNRFLMFLYSICLMKFP